MTRKMWLGITYLRVNGHPKTFAITYVRSVFHFVDTKLLIMCLY